MDPMDILGGLLKRKMGGGGKGSDILNDIFKGGRQRPAPAPKRSPPPSSPRGETSLEAQAEELEDLLNVANDRPAARPSPSTNAPSREPSWRWDKEPDDAPPRRPQAPTSRPRDAQVQNEQALVLVRAMINAAKSDGRIDRGEQQAILKQLGDASPSAIRFLQGEFEKPLDVREFVWSVPLGMEQQVYLMSLIAMDVDSNAEASYLRDLAHGLRLSPETCEQLQRRLGGSRRS